MLSFLLIKYLEDDWCPHAEINLVTETNTGKTSCKHESRDEVDAPTKQ